MDRLSKRIDGYGLPNFAFETVTDAEGGVTTFAYDAAGNRTGVTNTNGNATQTGLGQPRMA